MAITLEGLGVHCIERSGLLSLVENLERRRENLLRILVYHRIGDPGEDRGLLDPTLLSANSQMFDQQMEFLAKNYRVLSILDLLKAIEAHQPLPPKSVMVTFDDGYKNFSDIAWPILKHHQIPTLLFLATGFISSSTHLFWWDRLYQGIYKTHCTRLNLPSAGNYPLENRKQRWETFIRLKQLISSLDYHKAMPLVDQILEDLEVIPETAGLLLNWPDARFLSEQGCYLAAHTRNHPILSRIPLEEAGQEIRGSRQDICREIGTMWPVFSYPSGQSQDWNDDLVPILHEEGFQLAMTSIPGINIFPRTNFLQLKRIGPSPRLTFPEFQSILTGIYHIYSIVQRGFNTRIESIGKKYPGNNGKPIYLPD